MESYYFEGDASSVCLLFLGALMYLHPISDNLPTNNPSLPPLVQPYLSLKHRAKLNLYEVYCVSRTNYTKLYKLYERLMVSKWKKTSVRVPIQARRMPNFPAKKIFQTPPIYI